jgi:hypothetical protein
MITRHMQARIASIGIIAPSVYSMEEALPYLTNQAEYHPQPVEVPSPSFLSPREKRRTSASIRLALSVAEQCFRNVSYTPQEVGAVFASSTGESEVLNHILQELATEARQVSPTQFHNSVHNSPAGYWNIGQHSFASTTSIAAYDHTAEAALLKSLMQVQVEQKPVLLVAYDMPCPEPLHAKRPIDYTMAIALLLEQGKGVSMESLVEGKSAMAKRLLEGNVNPVVGLLGMLEKSVRASVVHRL